MCENYLCFLVFLTVMIYIGRPTWAHIKTLLLHVDEVGYWGHEEMIFHSWVEFLSNNKKIMVILCFPYPSPYGRTCRFSGLLTFLFFSYRLSSSTHHNICLWLSPYLILLLSFEIAGCVIIEIKRGRFLIYHSGSTSGSIY